MADEWIQKIEEAVKNIDKDKEEEHWKKLSIYKVPSCITQLHKTVYAPRIVNGEDYPKPMEQQTAYEPCIVSFGPYHHGKDHLKPMEEHKHRALLHFLKRSNKSFEYVVKSLKEVVKSCKESYDQLAENWKENDHEFLQLMILDGCFMLEILYFATNMMNSNNNYASNDPIFSDHGMLNIATFISRDMLKLENQLPIAVLYKLADGATYDGKVEVVNNAIFHFFFSSKKDTSPPLAECLHILDAYRKILLNWFTSSEAHSGDIITFFQNQTHDRDDRKMKLWSATELEESGIQFQESKTKSIKDISFQGGILRLPFVVVDDSFESTFLNLLAFERFHAGAGSEVTSYIYFMDTILAYEGDVALLKSKGLVENGIGSDNAAAQMFHLLAKDVALDQKSSLRAVVKQINDYCQKPWIQLRSFVIHTYVHNRFPILSLPVAIIIFSLAASQTLFTIYPYYHPRGK